MGEVDLHLFAEGQHWIIYDKFGAHMRTIGDATGVFLRYGRLNAHESAWWRFQRLDGRVDPMRKLIGSGVWELFLPQSNKERTTSSNPRPGPGRPSQERSYAFFKSARKIDRIAGVRFGSYSWNDGAWMESRRTRNWPKSPISTLRSAPGLVATQKLKREIVTSVISNWQRHCAVRVGNGLHAYRIMPVAEHPFEGSGVIRSQLLTRPPAGRHARLLPLFLANASGRHRSDLDWVPAHFPREPTRWLNSMEPISTSTWTAPGCNGLGTLIFNFGRNEVSQFPDRQCSFLARQYHHHGLPWTLWLRCFNLDYSGSPANGYECLWRPRESRRHLFFERFNEVVTSVSRNHDHRGESTDWPGVSRPVYLADSGSGQVNMGWMTISCNT